jgi:cob(I)alamin adenosyltransferase
MACGGLPRVRITKVYTRSGDQGLTSLVGGRRVSKAHPRIDACGDVDELNSVIGLVRAYLDNESIDELLKRIQHELFTLGADLASPPEVQGPRIQADHVMALEKSIDRFLKPLPPLKEFILPWGTPATALLHFARTVARRAERSTVKLMAEESVSSDVLAYLNRLSDLLFVLARVTNRNSSAGEEQIDFRREPD